MHVHEAREVLRIKEADNALFALLRIVHRNARVLLFTNPSHSFFKRQINGKREHVVARYHDPAPGEIREFQGAVDHLLFGLWQQAKPAAGGDDQLELVGRMSAAIAPQTRTESA